MLHDGDLIVVGAPPGTGKTGLLLGMTSAGAKAGPVGLISGEQPAMNFGFLGEQADRAPHGVVAA